MKPAQLPFRVVALTAALAHRPGLGGPLPLPLQRRWLELMAATLPHPSGTVVRGHQLGDRPGLRVTVGATERPRAILYLHGGGYTVGSPRAYRSLAAFLAEAAGAVVYLLDYRLAPRHPYPGALDDAVAACVQVAREHGDFALAGDSAGGGLAVATTRRLIDTDLRLPAGLGLLSPWVNPMDRSTARKRDLIVRDSWGKRCAASYLAGGDPADPGFAPALGNLAGLPPTMVQIGKREILYFQVMAFNQAMREAGVTVQSVELERLWHVGQAEAGLLAEAHQAVQQLGSFLRQQLDRQAAA